MMATIKLSQSFVDLMKKKHLDQKTLLMMAAGGIPYKAGPAVSAHSFR